MENKREQEIKEEDKLFNLLFDLLYKNKEQLKDNRYGNGNYSLVAIAKLFADAGYRKQSEVVKEVLLKVKTDLLPRAYEETGHTLTYYLYELAKQYEVEL